MQHIRLTTCESQRIVGLVGLLFSLAQISLPNIYSMIFEDPIPFCVFQDILRGRKVELSV